MVVVSAPQVDRRSFWARSFANAIGERWDIVRSQAQVKRLRLDEGCAGVGAATNGCLALGIPLEPVLFFSCIEVACTKFKRARDAGDIAHNSQMFFRVHSFLKLGFFWEKRPIAVL